MTTRIRALTRADASDYRTIRLHALEQAPTAFTSSFETARELPDEFYADRADDRPDNFIMGAFVDGQLVGTAGGFVEKELKRRHIAFVVGMWVEPNHRRSGLARRLLDTVVKRLQHLPHVSNIQLSVTADNAPALSLYEDYGFSAWGREPAAVAVDGLQYDEIHMALPPQSA